MKAVMLLAIMAAFLIWFRQEIWRAAQTNYAGWMTVSTLIGNKDFPQLGSSLQRLARENCRLTWFQAALAGQRFDLQSQRENWLEAMRCSPRYIPLVRKFAPQDEELAQQATQKQPASAQAWFWLAELTVEESPEQAIHYYRRGLAIDPSGGWDWVRLGRLLEEREPLAAIQAYAHACFLDDPGLHGCYGAGYMSEKIGDIEAAIRFYRLSSFPKAQERAAELERQTSPSP